MHPKYALCATNAFDSVIETFASVLLLRCLNLFGSFRDLVHVADDLLVAFDIGGFFCRVTVSIFTEASRKCPSSSL
jgi:hypothetical protein